MPSALDAEVTSSRSEFPARLAAALVGSLLLVGGVVATFITTNGAGAAALVSVGTALLLGAALWDQIESLTVGSVGVKKRLDAAKQFSEAGLEDEAETIRADVLDDLVPEAASAEDRRADVGVQLSGALRDL